MTILDLSEFRNLPNLDEPASDAADYTTWQLIAIRVVMAVGLLFVSAWLVTVFLLALIGAVFLRRWASPLWHSTCLASACLTACFVGLFSARFGITILCLYLLIHASDGGGRLIVFLRSRVQRAFNRL